MAVTRWQFEALDTLFFREAVPFNAGEGGQGEQTSMFPPTMNTLQGAIRYQLAVEQGWRPEEKNWPTELGDSDSLGDLILQGPYLCYKDRLLFPAPLFLMRLQHEDKENRRITYHRLSPGPNVCCDLGTVRLPLMPPESAGAKSMEGCWLTGPVLEKVLAGGVPEVDYLPLLSAERESITYDNRVYDQGELWRCEPKVGITRDCITRTASDNNLYSVNMIRPVQDLSIVVGVDGIPDEWIKRESVLVNLGGEGKSARLTVTDKPIKLPSVPDLESVDSKVRFTVTLITPGYFGGQEQTRKALKDLHPWIMSDCVTACIGKTRQIGGWDLRKKRPRPLRSFIPAGSTWFFEESEKNVDAIKKLHGQFIGDKSSNAYGYGQILIGRWEEEK